MNIKLFEPVLQQIRSENIRSFTINCLRDAPDYLERIPASSTGKYHHRTSLGEGGLVRHILRACHFATYFMTANDISPEDIRGDVILSALILHDIGKKAKYDNYFDYPKHPMVAVEMVSVYKHLLPEKVFVAIKNAILFHMGRYSDKAFKKPMTAYTLVELIVYNSDYLSAKKELEIMPPT